MRIENVSEEKWKRIFRYEKSIELIALRAQPRLALLTATLRITGARPKQDPAGGELLHDPEAVEEPANRNHACTPVGGDVGTSMDLTIRIGGGTASRTAGN